MPSTSYKSDLTKKIRSMPLEASTCQQVGVLWDIFFNFSSSAQQYDGKEEALLKHFIFFGTLF